jgi:hypothetical protein
MAERDFYSMTLEERWKADQLAADERDPWRSTRTLSRDAHGNLVQSARTSPPAQRVDQAAYDRMTYPERVSYAAQFSGGK